MKVFIRALLFDNNAVHGIMNLVQRLYCANAPNVPFGPDCQRHLGITSIQAAVRKGKLAERVTLPVFLACLFLHSDAESARLLKRDTPECYAEKFVSCTNNSSGVVYLVSLGRIVRKKCRDLPATRKVLASTTKPHSEWFTRQLRRVHML